MQRKITNEHIFIVNPISGRSSSSRAVELIDKIAKRYQLRYQVIYSKYPGHSKKIAKDCAKIKNAILYACGGDGTINEVLNGMNLSQQLAVIPCGSGNDFYYSLEESKINIETIIEETINGKVVDIDYGVVNNHRFINIGNLGLDAKVNYLASEKYRYHRLIPMKLVYIYAAIQCAFKPEKIYLKLDIDGAKVENESILMAITNGKRYGGGFKPTPDAILNDGLLNVCLIDYVKTLKIMKLMSVYFKGKHINNPICHFYKAKNLVINCDKKVYFSVDGETIYDNNFKIRVKHKMLKLRVGKSVWEKLNENTK